VSRKASPESAHGFGDIIGVVLLAAALLLAVAQLSFERNDIAFLTTEIAKPAHNWIGRLGAYFAWVFFVALGAAAYLLPLLFVLFGTAYLFDFLRHLKERLRWSALWTGMMLIALTGLLHLMTNARVLDQLHERIGANSAGGMLGWLTYGQTERYEFGLSLAGPAGATIIYSTLGLVSLLFLTNFRLGEWLRGLVTGKRAAAVEEATDEEAALERRARELEKQAKRLQEEVARSGLGADLQPVPEPQVRDLSVPQVKPGRAKKPAPVPPVKEPEPADEVVVISPQEIGAATTADILGKPGETKNDESRLEDKDVPPGEAEAKPAEEKVPEKKPDPVINITGLPSARAKPKKPKPITVAATPLIGNYQLPSLEFLQHPDMTVKPTESREELMANARLMQQTLAQFDIEVSLGDITKGPTITRYELHPAPGVKLEKITALNNNLAAAVKAERIHILAPVPGKSSVGIEVPNPVKTKVIMRDLFETDEWRNTKARLPVALGKDVYGHPIVADLTEMPHLLIAGATGAGTSVCINAIIASLLFRFSPDNLRFVMIDPKVVELQHYNALPHLVVPVVTDPKKVILALRWVVNEMEKRYQIFARVGVRNIGSFEEQAAAAPGTRTAPARKEGKGRAGRGRFRGRGGRRDRRAARGGHRHS
jgi:S-DNA-T family DNA segregation ATPase FtsK/SpoIIIE